MFLCASNIIRYRFLASAPITLRGSADSAAERSSAGISISPNSLSITAKSLPGVLMTSDRGVLDDLEATSLITSPSLSEDVPLFLFSSHLLAASIALKAIILASSGGRPLLFIHSMAAILISSGVLGLAIPPIFSPSIRYSKILPPESKCLNILLSISGDSSRANISLSFALTSDDISAINISDETSSGRDPSCVSRLASDFLWPLSSAP